MCGLGGSISVTDRPRPWPQPGRVALWSGHETCIRRPREISVAKAKSAKNQAAADGQVTSEGPPTPKGSGVTSVEPMVIALAEQLGTFLGRVQAKAEGWLENDALREQVGQIRDGAANLLKHVNSASTAARNAVMKPKAKMSKAKSAASAAKGRSGERWMRRGSGIGSRHRRNRSIRGWVSRQARRRGRSSSRSGRAAAEDSSRNAGDAKPLVSLSRLSQSE